MWWSHVLKELEVHSVAWTFHPIQIRLGCQFSHLEMWLNNAFILLCVKLMGVTTKSVVFIYNSVFRTWTIMLYFVVCPSYCHVNKNFIWQENRRILLTKVKQLNDWEKTPHQGKTIQFNVWPLMKWKWCRFCKICCFQTDESAAACWCQHLWV